MIYWENAISTESSSAHVEERDHARIPKPVSTGVENGENAENRDQLRMSIALSAAKQLREITFFLSITRYEQIIVWIHTPFCCRP